MILIYDTNLVYLYILCCIIL